MDYLVGRDTATPPQVEEALLLPLTPIASPSHCHCLWSILCIFPPVLTSPLPCIVHSPWSPFLPPACMVSPSFRS